MRDSGLRVNARRWIRFQSMGAAISVDGAAAFSRMVKRERERERKTDRQTHSETETKRTRERETEKIKKEKKEKKMRQINYADYQRQSALNLTREEDRRRRSVRLASGDAKCRK